MRTNFWKSVTAIPRPTASFRAALALLTAISTIAARSHVGHRFVGVAHRKRVDHARNGVRANF